MRLLALAFLLVSCTSTKEKMETCTKMCSISGGVLTFFEAGENPVCICQQQAAKH